MRRSRSGLREPELVDCAESLGRILQPGDQVLLSGPMGAGKTTFVRGLSRGLQVERPERVCSPTFNICLVHPGPIPLVHVDLYRLDGPGSPAFSALGLEALVEGPCEEHGLVPDGAVLVVEWADLWLAAPSESLAIALERPVGATDVRELAAEAAGRRHMAVLQHWLG